MEDVTSRLAGLELGQQPVYLLKTKSSPSDAYEEHIAQLGGSGGYAPIFVPVLEHIFRDDTLRKLRLSAERFAFAGGSPADARRRATHNPAKRYAGLIFTSQRAVDAFASVLARLDPARLAAYFDPNMPLYVVGPATARGVRALGLPCPVLGEHTGNGGALAAFILEQQAALAPEVTHLEGRKLPLLFLVGEQRRDIIPATLQDEALEPRLRCPVTELVVYETGEAVGFEEEFTELVREARRARVAAQWVVIFSPQGCEAVLNALGWLDERTGRFSEALREIVGGSMRTRIATIGPTTRDFLVQQFGFEPDVCALKPSPEGVGEGILSKSES